MDTHDNRSAARLGEASGTNALDEPRVFVTEHGPYRVVGEVAIYDVEGALVGRRGSWYPCRCGGSRNKPFCDASHGLKEFDGGESADHRSIVDRRVAYAAEGLTLFVDRSRCAHFGQCTDRLPAVFRADAEPFVDPHGAPPAHIPAVVAGRPSGALAAAVDPDEDPVEIPADPSITPIVDGPYGCAATSSCSRSTAGNTSTASQTLCRCGQSGNKPFFDGSHWYAGFRDPLPPELVKQAPSLFEWVGGPAALERLTATFYEAILSEPDPVLAPVFGAMDPTHPQHVAAWLAETFGGPSTYTDHHGGYEHMLDKHRRLGLSEEQRRRWVARMVDTADRVGLPTVPGFRSTFVAYLEWGSRLAVANSQPEAAVTAQAPVPHWGWGQTPPFQPQPWDDPDAAEQGRRRHTQQQAAATTVARPDRRGLRP